MNGKVGFKLKEVQQITEKLALTDEEFIKLFKAEWGGCMKLTIKDFEKRTDELIALNEKTFRRFLKNNVKTSAIKEKLLNSAFKIFDANQDQFNEAQRDLEIITSYYNATFDLFAEELAKHNIDVFNYVSDGSIDKDYNCYHSFIVQGNEKEMKEALETFAENNNSIANMFDVESIIDDISFENRAF